VAGPKPESKVNCTATIFAASGTSKEMQPSPELPGAMFSMPVKAWQPPTVSRPD